MFQDSNQTSCLATEETLWLVFAQDRTEQQQFVKELAAKNVDLLQMNRLKDEFLACISHELKSPLTAVLGLSTLLKEQMLGALNPRQLRYAHLIYQSGRQLMDVVNDILDLTRIETAQLELNLAPVNIVQVCDRALKQAQQHQSWTSEVADSQPSATSAQGRSQQTEGHDAGDIPLLSIAQAPVCILLEGQHLTVEMDMGLEMLVADELRLRQMLANLLSNAIKFTEPGGRDWPPGESLARVGCLHCLGHWHRHSRRQATPDLSEISTTGKSTHP
ncbi:hypothetical protein DO97_07390 [Neosynechococcus sphagnicola sy1]|uniref:histidine kinase n=1 Tax=Neosynechococcus sphagnicola sy1 TaxID=1497020 RepID=A0A098TP56_9CYAN|nr:hypothetical protein DO97_07390 [Neosynechococcus sphagnicola sy1]